MYPVCIYSSFHLCVMEELRARIPIYIPGTFRFVQFKLIDILMHKVLCKNEWYLKYTCILLRYFIFNMKNDILFIIIQHEMKEFETVGRTFSLVRKDFFCEAILKIN